MVKEQGISENFEHKNTKFHFFFLKKVTAKSKYEFKNQRKSLIKRMKKIQEVKYLFELKLSDLV